MARREIVVWTDDVTGETTEEVIHEVICVEGITYAVDMGPDTHAAYLEMIEPYRSAGTRIGRAPGASGAIVRPIQSAASAVAARTVTRTDKEQLRAMRSWWTQHGTAAGLGPVVERGKIPGKVVEAFHKHGGRAPVVEEKAAPVKAPRKAARKAPEPIAPIVADVAAGKTPRKAQTVGAEMSLAFLTAGAPVKAPMRTESAARAKPRKRASGL